MNFPEPDIRWLPFGKLLFGMLLLVIIAMLAAIIALGRVEATTSHGLDTLLGGLLTLSGGFANWCFKENKGQDQQQQDEKVG